MIDFIFRLNFIFFILGAILFGILSIWYPFLGIAFGILFLVFFVWFILKRQGDLVIRFLVLLLLFLLGLTSSYHQKTRFETFQKWSSSRSETYVAQVLKPPELKNGSIRFLAKIDRKKILVQIKQTGIFLPLYGDIIKIKGHFKPISPPTNPGQFDYPHYLMIRNISGILVAQKMEVMEHRIGNPFKRVAYAIREKVLSMHRKTLPFPFSELYIGLIFGDQGVNLPDEISERFQKTGLTHLLVVSGAQVALLSGILLTILMACRIPFRYSFWLITLVNLIFFFLTGGGASIARAILMTEVALVIQLWKRKASIYHVMAFTAVILILLNPLTIFDIGAQLSFVATFSLIFGVKKLADLLPASIPEKWRIFLGTLFSPFLFISPLIWFYFHTFSPVSLVSNLLVINVVEALVIVGFFSTILGFMVMPLTFLLNQGSLLVMQLLNTIVTFLSDLPFSRVYIPSPPLFVLIMIYGIIFWIMISLEKKNRRQTWYACSAFGILMFCLEFSMMLPSRYLTVTFLDVGQGDSILIQTPSHRTILVDAGDGTHPVIQPALAWYGINRLDMVFMTHFHTDHMGGIAEVLQKNRIGVCLNNGIQNQAGQKIPAQLPQTFLLDHGIRLTILYPFQDQLSDEDENHNSIVLLLVYKNEKILLTGDIQEEDEQKLMVRYSNLLKADILKIAHHGSKTSSSEEWLDKVHPQFAVVSVGKYNSFHHPSKEILERIRKRGISVLRTDQDGAVTFVTDGKRLWYKKYINIK